MARMEHRRLRPPMTLAEARSAKLDEILRKADAAAQAVKAGYSAIEQESWPKQEAEAKALALNPEASAPLLRSIAAGRGIGVLILRDKVLANVTRAEKVTGLILGRQQAMEDQVAAAATVEAVQALAVTFSLQGG